MSVIKQLYKPSLALLTDLYQLTMAYGYWKLGRASDQSVFHLFFRKAPFAGGYAVAAGLEYAIEVLRDLRFDREDCDYLLSLTGNDGKPLFEKGFVDELAKFEFACDVDAIPEGTVVFANEPLVRVTGPILQAQIIETVLLNLVNFQTLVATKSARICAAAKGEAVIEFGLRRAQGIDGALAASRSAYIGGGSATSNVLAGRLFGIPVKGTHAHSWIMSFESEPEAFEGYATAMPNNCVFLVDTYDTIQGVRNAIVTAQRLNDAGHRVVGIRLDSGDLAYLSIEARQLLDAAGFNDAVIVGSNDLDEKVIESLKHQGAAINVWGVGTRLVTGHDQPALGGVYKLGAIRRGDGPWQPRVKISEQAIKTTTPGILQVRRFSGPTGFIGDMIYDQSQCGAPKDGEEAFIVDPLDATREKHIPANSSHEDLLVPIFRAGKCVYTLPALTDVRTRCAAQLGQLHATIRRFDKPHEYPVGLEPHLRQFKAQLIAKLRGNHTV